MMKCKCKEGHDVVFFTEGCTITHACKSCPAVFTDSPPAICPSCGNDAFDERNLYTKPICYCFTCEKYLAPCSEDEPSS